MQRIKCSEVWGGIRNIDMDVATSGISGSIWSSAADGGKGGDIYYFSVCSSDLLTRVALADLMGHGQEVSRLSQWIYDSLVARMNDADGGAVLGDLNRLAVEHGYKAITTAAVVAFYRKDANLYFSYAGHHPLLLYRKEKGRWEPVTLVGDNDDANLPLGVLDDARYDQARTPLVAGDRMFLYTDGVIEAPDADGELFGDERLVEILDAMAKAGLTDIKRGVLKHIREHTGGALDHDDVSLMILEVR